jgi:hypothetical protein
VIAAPGWLEELVTRVRNGVAPHSCDSALIDSQIFINVETAPALYAAPAAGPTLRPAGSRPEIEAMVQREAGEQRPGLATAAALTRAVSRLTPRAPHGLDRSPEQIRRSGDATALERARLLAVLARAAGLIARVCLLYREAEPAFHAVVEIRIMDAWTVFDPLANQFFIMTHRPYASAWDIQRQPAVVDRHPDHGRKTTVDSSFYRTVGITPPESEA